MNIGLTAASRIAGKQFTEIILHRNDKVKTFSDKYNSINIGGNTVVNPDLFFNKMNIVLKTSSDLE